MTWIVQLSLWETSTFHDLNDHCCSDFYWLTHGHVRIDQVQSKVPSWVLWWTFSKSGSILYIDVVFLFFFKNSTIFFQSEISFLNISAGIQWVASICQRHPCVNILIFWFPILSAGQLSPFSPRGQMGNMISGCGIANWFATLATSSLMALFWEILLLWSSLRWDFKSSPSRDKIIMASPAWEYWKSKEAVCDIVSS